MRIATFNINGIKARSAALQEWLKSEIEPDIVLLQELKSAEPETFLTPICKPLGFHVLAKGQKAYNGVAILSKKPISLRIDALPLYGQKDEDIDARYIEAMIDNTLIVGSLYLPNGNPKERKFEIKLSFMERLCRHMEALQETEQPWLIGGDYNICPDPSIDSYDPRAFVDDAICASESVEYFRRMQYLGLVDVWRSRHLDQQDYTYWDYTGGAWQKNQGVRIDHFLASPRVADRITACEIDKTPRNGERPSDHTPLYCDVALS